MIASPIYEEIVDFLAAGTTPDRIVAFRPSAETKDRVADLIRRPHSFVNIAAIQVLTILISPQARKKVCL